MSQKTDKKIFNVMNMCNMNGYVLHDAHLNVAVDQYALIKPAS